MGTVMAIAPERLRRARLTLHFTQLNAGIALGHVRPETVSRWERSKRKESVKVQPLYAETMRQLAMAADLLEELYDTNEERLAFLNSPQPELMGRTPRMAMLEDPPFGLRDVVRLLGRMAEGIPT